MSRPRLVDLTEGQIRALRTAARLRLGETVETSTPPEDRALRAALEALERAIAPAPRRPPPHRCPDCRSHTDVVLTPEGRRQSCADCGWEGPWAP